MQDFCSNVLFDMSKLLLMLQCTTAHMLLLTECCMLEHMQCQLTPGA